jgi:uncharacterized RDD family membrane protein YckC
MMTEDARPVWVGFWRRVLAFFLDSLVLGLAGLAVGTVLFDVLAPLAGPTRLIGLPVGLAYFGYLSSRAGGSATVGMRMLGAEVVSAGGRPIGLLRSLWRALVLQLPLSLNGALVRIDDPDWAAAFTVLASTCVFGVGLAQIILLLFNHPSRRLVHDLLSGAAVVRKGAGAVPKTRSRAPAVAFAVVLLALGGSAVLAYYPFEKPAGAGEAPNAVLALPEVIEAGTQDSTMRVYSPEDGTTTTTHSLIVTARLDRWPEDKDKELARVGDAALKTWRLEPGQKLRVVLKYGYDIGIASGWRTYDREYSPSPDDAAEAPRSDAKPASKSPLKTPHTDISPLDRLGELARDLMTWLRRNVS